MHDMRGQYGAKQSALVHALSSKRKTNLYAKSVEYFVVQRSFVMQIFMVGICFFEDTSGMR